MLDAEVNSFDPQLAPATRRVPVPWEIPDDGNIYVQERYLRDGSITDDIVDGFINAQTDRQLYRAHEPLIYDFFGRDLDLENISYDSNAVVLDMHETQTVLLFALQALELLNRDDLSEDNLKELGMPVDKWNRDYLTSRKRFILKSAPYAKFLKRGCQQIYNANVFPNTEDSRQSFVFEVIWESYDPKYKCRDILTTVINTLFTIHMVDVRSICVNGKEEKRVCFSGLSSIWWVVLSRLRNGRVGRCASCGRPFVSKRERGKKRLFCNDACRQREGKKRRELKSSDTQQ